jgi:8-oxo-dGTP pyrophosphatase MutT (NUDIX family)
MSRNPERWNVTFLLDALPPKKLVVLRRAVNKKFAPGLYTGIGGKVEHGENILESAYRELQEETGIDSSQVELHQFACADIDGIYQVYYFWGTYPHLDLPHSEDGSLSWVTFSDLLDLNLIPTTWNVCKVWQDLGQRLEPAFTVYMHRLGEKDGVGIVEVVSSSL